MEKATENFLTSEDLRQHVAGDEVKEQQKPIVYKKKNTAESE
jgi:hypothetical protein